VKSILQKILDGISYKDIAGRRQPRTFALFALLILALLLLTGGMALLQRNVVMQPVVASPAAIQITEEEPEQLSEPAIKGISESCPNDPAEWAFADAAVDMNYKVIQPACVYAGLERTIAWVLALRSGYSRSEARDALGFDEMPIVLIDQITIKTEGEALQEMSLRFTPPHPELTEWRVDENGDPAVSYGLRGCFRTSSVVGNRVSIWGGDYPVVCVVAEDAENYFIIYSLDEHLYTAIGAPTRSYLLFGYTAEHQWLWLGTQESPKIAINDSIDAASDREVIALLFDSRPWDAAWLEEYAGLTFQSLPEDWLAAREKEEGIAILQILDKYLQEELQ